MTNNVIPFPSQEKRAEVPYVDSRSAFTRLADRISEIWEKRSMDPNHVERRHNALLGAVALAIPIAVAGGMVLGSHVDHEIAGSPEATTKHTIVFSAATHEWTAGDGSGYLEAAQTVAGIEKVDPWVVVKYIDEHNPQVGELDPGEIVKVPDSVEVIDTPSDAEDASS